MTLVAEAVRVELGGRMVLDGVDVALRPGELVAVLGANGAGKSTLLRALAGQAPLAGGAVTLDGRPLETWSARERARRIAYLPQARHVAWPLSVAAVVALGRLPHRGRLAGVSPEDRAAVTAALTAMDVLALAERPVSALSGGELGRVLVARALAQGTDHLIADEPTAGLDPAHALGLFAHLAQLAAAGRAVAVATHDLSLAVRHASRILLLQAGRTLVFDTPVAALTEHRLAQAFAIRATITTIEGVPVVVPQAPLT
jgi:iron complex transport system ATP-binding protein